MKITLAEVVKENRDEALPLIAEVVDHLLRNFELKQGPQGPKGVVGLPGPQGPAWSKNEARALVKEVVRGEASELLCVDKFAIWEAVGAVISGDILHPDKPEFDERFRGPKGEQGVPGRQGEQGVPGPQGERGPQGACGPLGLVGPPGDRGLPGPQGESGRQGERGEQGIRGEIGLQGPVGRDGMSREEIVDVIVATLRDASVMTSHAEKLLKARAFVKQMASEADSRLGVWAQAKARKLDEIIGEVSVPPAPALSVDDIKRIVREVIAETPAKKTWFQRA